MKMKRMIIIGDLAIVVMVLYAWLSMFFGADKGNLLSSRGVEALKYFTVDSNLLMGLAALVSLIAGFSGKAGLPVRLLKYVATVAVSLTFLTVFAVFVPMLGVASMIQGSNLFFHLIVPILAVVMFLVGRGAAGIRFGGTFLAVVPAVVYGLFYAGNILINGRSNETDWYGFARWGTKMYLPALLLTMAVTWLIAVILWLAGGGRKKTDTGSIRDD